MRYYILETKESTPLYIAMKEYDSGISISLFSSSDKSQVEQKIKELESK